MRINSDVLSIPDSSMSLSNWSREHSSRSRSRSPPSAHGRISRRDGRHIDVKPQVVGTPRLLLKVRVEHINGGETLVRVPAPVQSLAAILEIDEHMNQNYMTFDPYPRRGEEVIIKKTPDYFL